VNVQHLKQITATLFRVCLCADCQTEIVWGTVISDLITQIYSAKEESMCRPFVFIQSYHTDLEAVSLTECRFCITRMSCRKRIFEAYFG
jgi:hypothetical protein